MSGNALRDQIRNECIHRKSEVAPIEDEMRENRLVRPISVSIRKSNWIIVNGTMGTRERLKELGWRQLRRV